MFAIVIFLPFVYLFMQGKIIRGLIATGLFIVSVLFWFTFIIPCMGWFISFGMAKWVYRRQTKLTDMQTQAQLIRKEFSDFLPVQSTITSVAPPKQRFEWGFSKLGRQIIRAISPPPAPAAGTQNAGPQSSAISAPSDKTPSLYP